jgi:arginase
MEELAREIFPERSITVTKPISKLKVIAIRYLSGRPLSGSGIPLDIYEAEKIYQVAGIPFEIVEPAIPEGQYTQDEVENIGIFGGKIAEAVAIARSDGAAVLMTGGNCCHITGVIGGLQDAHGPGTRIGLVWFDAHGDYNTSKTTISGMLGGMPVAVAAGLTYPKWRELSHIAAPIPTDRILVGVRNLDPAEEGLIRATDTIMAAPASGFPGEDLQNAIIELSERVDMIYLHIDCDILDEVYTPNHRTKEPGGPTMEQVRSAINTVMATGKVATLAVVSVYGEGEGAEVMVASGMALIRAGLMSWQTYGMG